MGLNLPTVTVTPGPTWANNVNTAFSVVDAHNHTSGNGVPITSAAININGLLSFNGNDATNFRSTRFSSQPGVISGANDVSCLFVVGGDLYYNSGAGQHIQITIGGALNASSIGGIGGDYATSGATVSYSSLNQTFTFWQSSGVSALLDVGPIKLHAISNVNYVNLQASGSMSSSYSLTLPTSLPGVQSFLTVDASGNVGATWVPDNNTIKVISNQLVATATQPEHGWELNGSYGNLTFPQNNIDSCFFAQYAVTITGVWIYGTTCGTSGITEFDLKYSPTSGGSFSSILSTTGKIASVTNLSALTGAASVATATLTNHGFLSGETVTIAGVTPTTVITSLSASSGVATVTLAGHGYSTGNYVTVAGATPADFNGTFVITGSTTNTFTYAVPTSLSGSASGTIKITGYNGVFTLTGVTTNSFTYAIQATLPSTATGTPTVSTRSNVYTDSGSLIGPQAGVTKPVIGTASIPAGSIIRWDLLQGMNNGATDARIRIYYKAS
jgi:hypothetical protein